VEGLRTRQSGAQLDPNCRVAAAQRVDVHHGLGGAERPDGPNTTANRVARVRDAASRRGPPLRVGAGLDDDRGRRTRCVQQRLDGSLQLFETRPARNPDRPRDAPVRVPRESPARAPGQCVEVAIVEADIHQRPTARSAYRGGRRPDREQHFLVESGQSLSDLFGDGRG
jgi:hypothetical protein